MPKIIINNFKFSTLNLLFSGTGIMLTIFISLTARRFIRTRIRWYYLVKLIYVFSFLTVILTRNWFVFLVGWEMVTVTTTIMLVWGNRRIARQYFIIQFVGSSLLLYAILMAINAGYPEVTALAEPLLQGLFILGLGMKSAIFGFHFWLPPIHSRAPAPVSAVLSGWVVKLGFITCLKLITGGNNLLLFLGLLMIFYGGIKALLATDYKVLLAYSTISQLGYIAVGIGSGSPYGYLGGIFHIIVHGIAKTGLFLGSGYWVKGAGSRCIYNFRDTWRKFGLNSLTTSVSVLSLMGLPLLAGYNSKYLIKHGYEGDFYLTLLLHAAAVITVLYCGRFLWWGILRDVITGLKKTGFKRINGGLTGLNTGEGISLAFPMLLLITAGMLPEIVTGYIGEEPVDYHLLTGLRNMLVYVIIAVPVLIKLKRTGIKEKPPPSLDDVIRRVYKFIHKLSIKSWEYDTEMLFEKYLYRWIFRSARAMYNIIDTGFHDQLLWIPLVTVLLLLWLAIV